MSYSAEHWRRLLNGYSGGFPRGDYDLVHALGHEIGDWDSAWQAPRGSGATLAVVHEGAYLGEDGKAVSRWLTGHGATSQATLGLDRVFRLPSP
jgi:hypothetical protein